jgi:hypothetical protein
MVASFHVPSNSLFTNHPAARCYIACATDVIVKLTTKVKEQLSLCLTNWALRHEDVWGSGRIDPRILDLGTSWSGQLYAPAALPPGEISPGTHWVGPRTGLDDVEKNLDPTGTRTPTPRSSSP